MGYYYARNAGFSETAAKAMGEFYWPMSAKSPLPSSLEGAALSMAGKADNLISDFYLGLIPSGSADPRGLRRQAMGLVRIVLEREISLDLKTLFGCAPGTAPLDAGPLLDFIWQRAEVIFEEAGYRFDEVKAVKRFFLDKGDLLDCRRRIKDLNGARNNPAFEALTGAFKRAQNILKQARHAAGAGEPDEAVFERDEERSLYAEIRSLSTRLKVYLANRDYATSLGDIVTVKPALDKFFDKVMVMAENPAVRENRLRLVSSLVDLFEDVADLSQLQQ